MLIRDKVGHLVASFEGVSTVVFSPVLVKEMKGAIFLILERGRVV